MILLSAILYSEATPFPGIAATLPSIGAMLAFGKGTKCRCNVCSEAALMVWFGRISYSTYLAHWPVIVFWLYLSITPPSTTDKFVLLLLSVLGGQLLHSLVAERFRYAPEQRRNAVAFLGDDGERNCADRGGLLGPIGDSRAARALCPGAGRIPATGTKAFSHFCEITATELCISDPRDPVEY